MERLFKVMWYDDTSYGDPETFLGITSGEDLDAALEKVKDMINSGKINMTRNHPLFPEVELSVSAKIIPGHTNPKHKEHYIPSYIVYVVYAMTLKEIFMRRSLRTYYDCMKPYFLKISQIQYILDDGW